MRSRLILGAVILSTLMATDAFARGGGGMGGGPGFAGNGGGPSSWQGSHPPGFSRGLKTGWNGGFIPPGGGERKKKGWQGHKRPPWLVRRQSGAPWPTFSTSPPYSATLP